MRQPAWAAPQTAAPHRLPGARAGRRSRPAWADASVARGCVRARVGGSGEEGGGLQAHKPGCGVCTQTVIDGGPIRRVEKIERLKSPGRPTVDGSERMEDYFRKKVQ